MAQSKVVYRTVEGKMDDDYYRRREYYRELDRRDEYRRQDYLDNQRRLEDRKNDFWRDQDRRDDEEYERKRLEESLEEDRNLISHPDAGRLLRKKYGFEDDRLLDEIWGIKPDEIPAGTEFEFQELKFYESGPHPPGQRRYAARFPKSKTRYVYFEVDMRNLLWKIIEHKHIIAAKYYGSDGSLFGETEYQAVVRPEWKTYWHDIGWGWEEAGNWPVGTYRVEIFIDGRKITEGHFTIYEDFEIPDFWD